MPSKENPESSGNIVSSLGEYPRGGTFHILLDWHLLNGTRPEGKPGRVGKRWSSKEFGATVLGRSPLEDTCRKSADNWRLGKSTPNDIASIERVLFGNSEDYAQWRSDLRTAHDRRKSKKDRGDRSEASKALLDVISRLASGNVTPDGRRVLQRAVFNGTLAVASPKEGDDEESASRILVLAEDKNIDVASAGGLEGKLRDVVSPQIKGRLPPRPQLVMIGRSDAMEEIKRGLGVSGGQPTSDRTVVSGQPGVGKTTLVSAVAHDYDVSQKFCDGIFWTALGQKPAIFDALRSWAQALGIPELDRCTSLHEMIDLLAKYLNGLRALLIIDDVWDVAHAMPLMQTRGQHCGLLLTTRVPLVANELSTGTGSVYNLPLLTENDALTLLRVLTPSVVVEKSSACHKLSLETNSTQIIAASRLL